MARDAQGRHLAVRVCPTRPVGSRDRRPRDRSRPWHDNYLLRRDIDNLTAIELDPVLADSLSRRLGGSNVTVVHRDATAMPFEPAQFAGAMTFTMFHHVPTVELQDRLLAEILRVLRRGGLFVASDDLAALHIDDAYDPVDPATLADRLMTIGFSDVDVDMNGFGWRCHARHPV